MKLKIFFIVIFWLSSSLLHLKFSLFLVSPLITPWGELTLKQYIYPILLTGFVLLMINLLLLHIRKPDKKIVISWLIWFATISLINSNFMATPIENIHFFQYAIIAYILLSALNQLATDFPLSKTLYWAVSLGVIDEILQYFYITRSYSNNLDFNDFWFNMLGGIAGMLFFMSRYSIAKDSFKFMLLIRSKELWLCTILILSSLTLLFTFNLSIERKANSFSHWNPDFFSGTFYVLSPLEGISIMLISLIIFSFFFISFPKKLVSL